MAGTPKVIFYGKVARSSDRLIITIPKELRPLVDVNKTYKITLEVVEQHG